MKMFILILFFHVGPMGDGNSNTTTNIPGFESEAECIAAGRKAGEITKGTTKTLEFTCVTQTTSKKQ
jgi:hypothetical protein